MEVQDRSARTPVVAMPHKEIENHLKTAYRYDFLGRNEKFVVQPSILHFPEAQLHRKMTQTLRVTNADTVAHRFHVVALKSEIFEVKTENAGHIAPGLSQKVTVTLTPKELRYHYDALRLHCGDVNILVPMHAYPAIAKVDFPTRLDLGHCPLAEKTARNYFLRCDVPIDFEYDLKVLEEHPHFRITTPMRGIIPAKGTAEIGVEFEPITLGTASFRLLLNVSQFGFKPVEVIVTASSLAGLDRERRLNETLHYLLETFGPDMGVPRRPICLEETIKAAGYGQYVKERERTATKAQTLVYDRQRPPVERTLQSWAPPKQYIPYGPGSGAVFDAGAEYARTLNRLDFERSIAANAPQDSSARPEINIVEGLKIPRKLEGVNAVNFVLTQREGKLKPADLKKVIAEQRLERAKQKAAEEALRRESGSAGVATRGSNAQIDPTLTGNMVLSFEKSIITPLEGENRSRQVLELAFSRDLKDIEDEEKERSFRSSVTAMGSKLLDRHEIEAIRLQRASLGKASELARRARDRLRTATWRQGPRRTGPAMAKAGFFVSGSSKDNSLESSASENASAVNMADLWRNRSQTIQRFAYLVGVWIVRQRAQRRILAIKERLGDAWGDRNAVRRLVEEDCEAARRGNPILPKENDDGRRSSLSRSRKEGESTPQSLSMEIPWLVGVQTEDDWRWTPGNIDDLEETSRDISFEHVEVGRKGLPSWMEPVGSDLWKEEVKPLNVAFPKGWDTEEGWGADEPPIFQTLTYVPLCVADDAKAMGYKREILPVIDPQHLSNAGRTLRSGAAYELGRLLPLEDGTDKAVDFSMSASRPRHWREADGILDIACLQRSSAEEADSISEQIIDVIDSGARMENSMLKADISDLEFKIQDEVGFEHETPDEKDKRLQVQAEHTAVVTKMHKYFLQPAAATSPGLDFVLPAPWDFALAPAPPRHEGNIDWSLRPRLLPINFSSIEKDRAQRAEDGIGMAVMAANEDDFWTSEAPTQAEMSHAEELCAGPRPVEFSSLWQAPLDMIAAPLNSLENTVGVNVRWSLEELEKSKYLPSRKYSCGDVRGLSDSESDDDEDDREQLTSMNLLEKARFGRERVVPETAVSFLGEDTNRAEALLAVKRDRCIMKAEDLKRQSRLKGLAAFSDKMIELSSKIRNLNLRFVVQRPYFQTEALRQVEVPDVK